MDIVKKVKDVFKKKDGAPKTEKDKRLEALMKEKEQATKEGEPWVAVLDTKINEDNIRNGFFELDWNNEFIEKLLDAGYKGETNEQIVDGWFKTIARNILQEEGMDPDRGAGYINVKDLGKDKSEISQEIKMTDSDEKQRGLDATMENEGARDLSPMVQISIKEYDRLKERSRYITDKDLISMIDKLEFFVKELRKHIVRIDID